MKHYIAAEARLIAKNVYVKQNKEEFNAALDYIMGEIETAAQAGEFSVVIEENINETVRVALKEMGYDVKCGSVGISIFWE